MITVVIRPAAERDVLQAFLWYENRSPSLGDDFMTEFQNAVDTICDHPRAFPKVVAGFRRKRMHRFPYAIFFAAESKRVVIAAVIHTSRHPRVWRRRLR